MPAAADQEVIFIVRKQNGSAAVRIERTENREKGMERTITIYPEAVISEQIESHDDPRD
jgi:hypothetical protein